MNKTLKIILISLATIFSIGLLFVEPVQADIADFVVEFQNTPLFDQANFLPGEDISRFVRVTNNTDISQKVGTRVSDFQDINKLGDVLNLQIKEGGTPLFGSTLSDFFKAGAIYFPEIPAHSSIQYDYIISFDPNSENEYQGKTLIFDFIVGRDIPSTTTTTTSGGGGGGGGGGSNSTATVVITEPGQVKGITTESEPLEEMIEQGGSVLGGTQNTNNVTTTTIPGLILGAATEQEPSSCKSKLLSLGINPFLASSFCLGENTCSTCLKPWWVLLLGLAITFGCAILAKKHHEKYD